MFENIVSVHSISFIFVFLEGILSFFSPCIIPLLPVYIGYLAGNAKKIDENGEIIYDRRKVFFHTVCFVIGISFAFFILGMSFTALGTFFYEHKLLFTRISGILIIVLGLFQLGIFDIKFLQKERKFKLHIEDKEVNPFMAFLMGFTFSFAWTPCVGPALSSVLILASSAKSSLTGNMLVLLYTVGFIIPFLLLGLFTSKVLNFLKAKRNLLKYAIKIAAVLLIFIGIMTFTGWMNGISGYLNSYVSSLDTDNKMTEQQDTEDDSSDTNHDTENKDNSSSEQSEDTTNDVSDQGEERETVQAFDFTLTDQYGNQHTLSDYKGKVVFLNFWATWCGPCQKEMPHIEELYQEYNLNQDEVVILGVANPSSTEYPHNQDVEKEEVEAFLTNNEYTFPVVFDENGEVFSQYYISSFPTTFMIDKEGNIYGYVAGMLTKDIMQNIITETLESTD